MLIKDFRKKLSSFLFVSHSSLADTDLVVFDLNVDPLVTVSTTKEFSFKKNEDNLGRLSALDYRELMSLVYNFAATPLEKRSLSNEDLVLLNSIQKGVIEYDFKEYLDMIRSSYKECQSNTLVDDATKKYGYIYSLYLENSNKFVAIWTDSFREDILEFKPTMTSQKRGSTIS